MKVLIDTNVLISAALNPRGVPYQAYVKAASYPNQGFISEQNVLEMKRIFQKKFPNHLGALEHFLSLAFLTIIVIPIPSEKFYLEKQIRDIKDRPILRAAIHANVDILLTGDKDFLESGIKTPLILTAAEFLKI